MNKLIALILILSVAGCTLRPAPITTMDVRATLAGLPADARVPKAIDLSKQITQRKNDLREHSELPEPQWMWWVFMPITTGIVYACYTPARNASRNEIRELEKKEKIISEILDGASDSCESSENASSQ